MLAVGACVALLSCIDMILISIPDFLDYAFNDGSALLIVIVLFLILNGFLLYLVSVSFLKRARAGIRIFEAMISTGLLVFVLLSRGGQILLLFSWMGLSAVQVTLASFYEHGNGGLLKNETEAVRLYKLAADQGHSGAQGELGFFYESGRGGLSKDEQQAARLYKLAAAQGNPYGQTNLGLFYETGRGGLSKDEQEAARLYKLAADQRNKRAQVNLGYFHETGRGVYPKMSEKRRASTS
jgi:TPR repeat protein